MALCLLRELSAHTTLSTTGPDLKLQGWGRVFGAALAQMSQIVQRNQITQASGKCSMSTIYIKQLFCHA